MDAESAYRAQLTYLDVTGPAFTELSADTREAWAFMAHTTGARSAACNHHPACADDDPTYPAWHFLRTCGHCGNQWCSLHCPCDGHQNPCSWCGMRNDPIPCPDWDSAPQVSTPPRRVEAAP